MSQQRVMFTSRFSNHRLTIEPQRALYEGGRYAGESKGRAVVFENGVLIDPTDGKPGTSDPEIIDFLRERMAAGTQIYELPQAAPDPAPLLKELVTCDFERTQQILEDELEGYQREDIIEAAQEKLALLSEEEPDGVSHAS